MILSLQLLTFLVILKTGESFVVHQSSPSPPPDITTRMRTPAFSSSSSSLSYARHSNTEDPEEMRKEIAALREEALQKLHVLQERIDNVELVEVEEEEGEVQHDETSTTATATITSAATALDHHVEEASFPKSGEEVILDFMERERAALEETNSMVGSETSLASDSATITSTETSSTLTTSSASSPDAVPTQAEALRRLDDTRWRVMLNIGREPGTWMPNEWGASGDRLHLHLELEFSSDALLMDEEGEGEEDAKGKKGKHGNKHKKNLNYPGDDFLNGRSYTKILKVVQNEASMSPTMTEGARKVRVHNGAWRVAPFEGPMGTTVLRFYVELEEQASHGDSDVWCPAGRVYCTCGYFPMYHDPITGLVSTCSLPSTIGSSNSKNKNKEDAVVLPVSCLKAALKEEQEQIASYYEALARANHEDPAIFSWDKLKRSSQMMKLKQDATKLAHKRHELNIREPDKNVLRLSQDQQVGITREGGVCCKVHKGLAVEYHMLGKFEIASMKNRDHKDYRELLMP